jgi:hypothetical protein
VLHALTSEHLEIIHLLRHIPEDHLALLVKLNYADFEHGSREITIEYRQGTIDEEVLGLSHIVSWTIDDYRSLFSLNLTCLVVLVVDFQRQLKFLTWYLQLLCRECHLFAPVFCGNRVPYRKRASAPAHARRVLTRAELAIHSSDGEPAAARICQVKLYGY